jgi:polyhydroxyalkanoate synthesis regulator phasin
MLNDLRGYIELANGLSEVTSAKAKEIAMMLVSQGLALSTKAPDVKGQIQELADELLSTSRHNREMLVGLVRAEVDRTVGRMGFVREDELAAVRRHVQRLEQQLHELQGKGAAPKKPAAKKPAARKSAAKKPAAKKSAAKDTSATAASVAPESPAVATDASAATDDAS